MASNIVDLPALCVHTPTIIGNGHSRPSMAERPKCSRLCRRAADGCQSLSATGACGTACIKGRQIVARQRELIERIRARDGDCDKAEGLLSQFEATLAIFEQDLAASANQKRG